jgi:hypothetical protein
MSRLAVLPKGFDDPHIFVPDAFAASGADHPQEHASETVSLLESHENQRTAIPKCEIITLCLSLHSGEIQSRHQYYQLLSDQPPGGKGKHGLGELCRSNDLFVPSFVHGLPPDLRASLALFCYRRSHLHSMGLAIAASCDEDSLVWAGGSVGAFIFTCSREAASCVCFPMTTKWPGKLRPIWPSAWHSLLRRGRKEPSAWVSRGANFWTKCPETGFSRNAGDNGEGEAPQAKRFSAPPRLTAGSYARTGSILPTARAV